MKRVKAGCILQTLVFSQKPDLGLSKEQAQSANKSELVRYQNTLQRSRTRYQIVEESVLEDGSVLVRIKKQLNERTDTSKYFN